MITFTLPLRYDTIIADEISLYVQDVGGRFEIHRHIVEFYVPTEYREFTILKYPFLSEVIN